MPVRILDGVFQLLTPFPQFTFDQALAIRHDGANKPKEIRGLPYVLPYMVKSRGDTMLIDCGWNTPQAYDALVAGMAEHGSHPSEVTRLVITHIHPDHYGMAGKVKQVSGAELLMHRKEADLIGSRYFAPIGLTDEMADYMAQHGVPPLDSSTLSKGSMPMLDKVAAVPADVTVHGGEGVRAGEFDFEVVWTPGHTAGHICLYEPNHKILLTGDHILPTITPNISMHTQAEGNPLGDYIASLDKVADLDVKYVLPAHEYDITDLKRRIDEIRDHHRFRLDEMLKVIDTGGSTAWEVASRVRWATGSMADFEPFMQRAAVGETLSHLEYLFENEQLMKVKRNGTVIWIRV